MLMMIHRMSDVDPFYKEMFYLEQLWLQNYLQFCNCVSSVPFLSLLKMSHRGLTACPRAVRRVHVSEGEGEWGGGPDLVLPGGRAGRGGQRPEPECIGWAGDQEVGEAAGARHRGAGHGVVDGDGHGDSPPLHLQVRPGGHRQGGLVLGELGVLRCKVVNN